MATRRLHLCHLRFRRLRLRLHSPSSSSVYVFRLCTVHSASLEFVHNSRFLSFGHGYFQRSTFRIMDAIYGYHFLLSVRLPTEFPTAFPTVYVRLSNRHPCRVWVPSTPPEKSMSQCLCSRNPHSVLVPSTPPEKEHAAVPLLQTSCSVWVPSTPPEKSMSQCLCSRPLVLSHVRSLALGSSLVRPFVASTLDRQPSMVTRRLHSLVSPSLLPSVSSVPTSLSICRTRRPIMHTASLDLVCVAITRSSPFYNRNISRTRKCTCTRAKLSDTAIQPLRRLYS